MGRIRRYLSAFLALVLCLSVLVPTAVPVSALSTGYQDFVLWAPLGTKPGGWLEYAQTAGNNANIYPRNATTPYFDTSAYIENKDRELYIRPGSYTMELTEAGKLSYGSGWDITVSNGKNYKYVNLVGNASVQKVEYQYGTAGSKWTRVRFGNLQLGDVIRIEAYQQNHWLKVGDPRVKIFADGKDVTGRTTAVDSGTSIPISAVGYIDAETPRDGNLTLYANNGAKIEDGMITFTGGGTASVTATWKSYDGYFKAQSTSYFTVRDLSKIVKSIEVEGQETQYERLEGFKDQGTIIVHMMDGTTTERVDLVRKYVTGFDSSTAGTRTLTVAYGGCTTTYDIDVRWLPAGIQVTLYDASGYPKVRTGTIRLSGDVDHVTLPDGREIAPADLDSRYTFTENGTFEFAATGKGGDTASDTVTVSGIDKEPPELRYELADGKVTLKSWDTMSGLKSVRYFELGTDWAHANQHTTSSGAWTADYDLDGVAGGMYRVVATDYAGNSTSVDIPVNVETVPEPKPDFKVYVPARVTMSVDKTGAVTFRPEGNYIYNGVETEAIRTKAVSVDVADGWTLEDFDSDFSVFEKDSNRIGLKINGSEVNKDGTVDIMPEEWIIPADEKLELVLDAKASTRTESLSSVNVLKLNFVTDWYEDGENLTGEKHVMTIVGVQHATVANGMVQVETNEYGKVTMLPRVTVDNADYYTFMGWVNAGTGMAVNVGDVLTEDITIRPVVDDNARVSYIDLSRMQNALKDLIGNITFVDEVYNGKGGVDISQAQDKSVLVVKSGRNATVYGHKAYLPEDCQNAFAKFKAESMDLRGLDTSNVRQMHRMFADCSSLTSLDVSGFDTGSAVHMSYMFDSCSSLTSLDVSGFDTGNMWYMDGMFYNCSSLTSLDVTGFDTGNVTDMSKMFGYCRSLTSLDVTGFDSYNVTDMSEMFKYCSNLTSLDVTGFDTGNVTDMHWMFDGCSNLTSLDVTGFDTYNVISMNSMFSDCSSLTSLDVSGFDTYNVTDINYMFYNCSSLTNLDLFGFDTCNVTSMYRMFKGCSSLISLDLSGFDTRNVKDMADMFFGCSSLASLDLSGFDTRNVTNMSAMFSGCSSLISLDLSGFDTRKVTNMKSMFYGCKSLTSLDLSGFDTSKVTDMSAMFSSCSSLTSLCVRNASEVTRYKSNGFLDSKFAQDGTKTVNGKTVYIFKKAA